MEYAISYKELRKVIRQACEDIISHKQMVEFLYKHIDDAVEYYLDECIVETEEDE